MVRPVATSLAPDAVLGILKTPAPTVVPAVSPKPVRVASEMVKVPPVISKYVSVELVLPVMVFWLPLMVTSPVMVTFACKVVSACRSITFPSAVSALVAAATASAKVEYPCSPILATVVVSSSVANAAVGSRVSSIHTLSAADNTLFFMFGFLLANFVSQRSTRGKAVSPRAGRGKTKMPCRF